MNVVVLSGALVRDVELRYTSNDKAVANFTIAVRRDLKNKDGEYESDFLNCIAYGKLGETISQYFKKGSRILIDGKIQTGSYEGQDGKRVYTTNVVVNNINFIDKAEKTSNEEKKNGKVALPF